MNSTGGKAGQTPSLEKPRALSWKGDVSGLPLSVGHFGWLLAVVPETSGNTPALGSFEIPLFLAG